jgi:O-antigen/teichoic acid export membrane protein
MDLALASVAEISHWPGQLILQGLARYRGFGPAYICAAIAKPALATLLVRSYGLIGVALGTLISALALSIFMYFRTRCGLSVYPSMTCFGMACCLRYCPDHP